MTATGIMSMKINGQHVSIIYMEALGFTQCGASSQSPIDINTDSVVNDTNPHANLEFLEETSV